MFNNAVLDIAIALILMYLVLSLTVTIFNEFVASLLKWRASTLGSAIEQLIDDPNLKEKFYKHGLIAGTNDAVNQKQDTQEHKLSYLSGETFALAILGSLDPKNPLPGFADIQQLVQSLPEESSIRGVLLAYLATANNKLETLRDGVAKWFDTAMDRVSGVYKRKAKRFSLYVGLAMAFVMNADSIQVGRALWKDSSLRAAMVEAAKSAPSSTSALGAGTTDLQTLQTVFQNFDKAETIIRPLPIGWNLTCAKDLVWNPLDFFNLKNLKVRCLLQGRDLSDNDPNKDSNNEPFDRLLIPALAISKIIGLVLTGLALSLGAPFWFDLLSKFLRATGPKPNTASGGTS